MEASGGCIRASGGRMGAIRHMGMWALVKAVWGLVESYWGQDEIRTIGVLGATEARGLCRG